MGNCQVVGNMPVGSSGCFISINTSSNTEPKLICGESKPFLGDTIQTVTVTGYAAGIIHVGNPGKAGFSSALTRKYDCDDDCMRFLCDGKGSSYVFGDVGGLASVQEEGATTEGFSASAASGPSSFYVMSSQTNGFGLFYTGGPISFSSAGDDQCTMLSLAIGSVSGSFYLQSFSLDVPSGQLPVASYTAVRVAKQGGS